MFLTRLVKIMDERMSSRPLQLFPGPGEMSSGKVSDAEAGRPEFNPSDTLKSWARRLAFVAPTPGREADLRACASQCS